MANPFREDRTQFLSRNRRSHSRPLVPFLAGLAWLFTGGTARYALMGLLLLRTHWGRGLLRKFVLPLVLARMWAQVSSKWSRQKPAKRNWRSVLPGRRQRSPSVPSARAAAAFAGAWLLKRYFPKPSGWLYTLATLAAFSRIFQRKRKRYPTKWVVGAGLGVLAAIFWFRRSS